MSLCPGPTARQSVSSCIRRRKRLRAASTASIPIPSSMRSRRGRSRLRTADEDGRRGAVRARHILRISSVIRKWSYGKFGRIGNGKSASLQQIGRSLLGRLSGAISQLGGIPVCPLTGSNRDHFPYADISRTNPHRGTRIPSGELRLCDGCLMGIKPPPNIRDGVLVERLVETAGYVTDMRRCQHVVERPEWVIRRQRLNVEYVDRRAGDSLVL